MLIRNCAGALVFCGDKVLLVRGRGDDWGFPKDVIREGKLSHETALGEVRKDSGISAEIVSTAGLTNYDFFSVTKQKPICDKTIWYIMKSPGRGRNTLDGQADGGFFSVEEAMKILTRSQDRALLHLSHGKYREFATQKAG